MTQSPSIETLPLPLATAIRPWISAVDTATLGGGDEVRATVADAIMSLRRRIVLTPPLDTALDDARIAATILADKLDRKDTVPSIAKAEAMTALGALVSWLHGAQPNERAKGLGLGW